MVRLVPMTDTEFHEFVERTLLDYARDKVASGEWTASESVERSRAEFDRLLPQGLATPDQYLFTLKDDARDERVGDLWFAVRRPPMPPGGFIYDIFIDAAHRRKGHAEAALRALEPFARAHGAETIGLHVFGYNHGAIALYQKVGYETTNLLMRKTLDGRTAP